MKNPGTMALSLSAVLLTGYASTAISQGPPFGDPDSLSYAAKLWQQLEAANFVGSDAMMSKAYAGQHPHGAVLDTMEGRLSIDGHTGAVIVKKNYGGDGVSISNVGNDPAKYLKAITVMYKRESGYDPEDRDWFWAKFKANGELDKNPKGMSLAGKVAKGKPMGCIACHTAAPGGDFVFNNDRYK